MKGITIKDKKEGENLLAIDLIDLLLLNEDCFSELSWRVEGVECVGQLADSFYEAEASKRRVPGVELIRLAKGVDQTIDGTFEGYRLREEMPFVKIVAVDSSAFDFYCIDQAFLECARRKFSNIEDIPNCIG